MRIGLREVLSLAFGPDGRTLMTSGQDGWVRFWDLATGRQRLAVRPHARHTTALALSDDGRTLASASACERVARLRDVATGRESVALRGHTAPVQALAFAPGGRMVATGASDETVRLWDVPSGRESACPRCPGIRPGVITFSRDGRALAAGGSSRRSGSGTSPACRGRRPSDGEGPTVAVCDRLRLLKKVVSARPSPSTASTQAPSALRIQSRMTKPRLAQLWL
jgi:WD40 repeat protein